jgi:murein DD-endopeptidase MepM/ murein hydrolase activator NlpD
LDQVKYTESVQSQVASLLQQIKAVKAKLELDQAELEANLNRLKELESQLVETQDALANQKLAKEKFLADVKGKESNYKKLLSTAQQQEAQINKEINDLEASLRGKGSPSKLKPVRGILAWPMDGVITQNYGNTGFTKLGYNFHNGLDIAAPAGTNIYAAADGVVNATGTGQAAYGNWVTIKHTLPSGKEIVTLYAHMISFRVKVGQRVQRGDLVGYQGNTGNTSRLLYGPERGYHLHFTVFDAEGFGISQGQHTATYGAYRVPYGYTYNPKDFL